MNPITQVGSTQHVVADDDRLSADEEFDHFGPWEEDDYDRSLYY